MTEIYQEAGQLVDALIEKIGKRIVLGLPVGIGKSLTVANALYARAAMDRSISLTIFTGLTLETPGGSSDLEKRFVEPLAARLYGEWPRAAYAVDIAKNALPANVSVREFYLRPGAYLGNALVQQNYTSINYSQVAAELAQLGINVVAQLVATRPESPGRYSLGSNPDITLDLLAPPGGGAAPDMALVGQVNRHMPYMTGDAEIAADQLAFVLDDPDSHHPLFPLPNRPVAPADYATGMHVTSLVPDGGTIQVGIGSLSDAVAHCLRLRNEAPALFREVLALLPGGSGSAERQRLPIEDRRFEKGLFASTELLGDALFALFEHDILKRRADEDDDTLIQAGFFIGSSRLYEQLLALPEAERNRINMTSISNVNTLFGNEAYKRGRRTNARFINETMMVTLLGAAVSDGLGDGRVVSGVGGQFDFVTMAQSLHDAQSILMCRARRESGGEVTSNILWNYPHTTVPRHYRDVYVSEYGIAATRGMTDSEVIAAMLGIADSAFQGKLAAIAKAAGKLPADFSLAVERRGNTPERLHEVFDRAEWRDRFPPYPMGTDFTDTERRLIDALSWLKTHTGGRWRKLRTTAAALFNAAETDDTEALERMALAAPEGLRAKITSRLLAYALQRTKA